MRLDDYVISLTVGFLRHDYVYNLYLRIVVIHEIIMFSLLILIIKNLLINYMLVSTCKLLNDNIIMTIKPKRLK